MICASFFSLHLPMSLRVFSFLCRCFTFSFELLRTITIVLQSKMFHKESQPKSQHGLPFGSARVHCFCSPFFLGNTSAEQRHVAITRAASGTLGQCPRNKQIAQHVFFFPKVERSSVTPRHKFSRHLSAN